jgi:hypothetical protein
MKSYYTAREGWLTTILPVCWYFCLPVVHPPCVQEANTAGTLAMLSGLGVAGAADTRLQLHSVLAGGKRRVTAEFSQAGQTAALQLQRVSGC